MKKIIFSIILVGLPFLLNAQIIANHEVVDKYTDIPQQYIDSVKNMWVQVLGESHSGAYRVGLDLLSQKEPKFKATKQEYSQANIPLPNDPENYGLRVSRIYWDRTKDSLKGGWYEGYNWGDPSPFDNAPGIGEEDFWTTRWARDNMVENIRACNDPNVGNTPLSALGFGWCWDICLGTGGNVDTAYGCKWGGRCFYFDSTTFQDTQPEGYYWGLDSNDNVLVDPAGTKGNVTNLMDYINTVEELNTIDPNTICFFTTGPVDNMYSAQSGTTDTRNEGEAGYQRYLKHKHIRDYVKTNGGVLFDYADILTFNNDGDSNTTTWAGHPIEPKTYPLIHPDNDGEYNNSHIGETGCIRLAKAMWWMLARMAGWDGDTIPEYKTHLYISICDGESYLAGGEDQTTTSIYYDTLLSADNYDSIIIHHLTVNPVYTTTIDTLIGLGNSFYAGGDFQDTSGTYYDTLQSKNFCDSIIITNLTVDNLYRTFTDISICEGESYTFNGNHYNTAGIYYDTLKASDDTDSLIITDITVIPKHETIINHEICEGDEYYAGGAYRSVTGSYYDTLMSANSCDSLIITNLTVENCTDISVADINIINIYPNPTKGLLTIEMTDINKDYLIIMYSVTGRRVFMKNCSYSSDNIEKINLSGSPPGLYNLVIISDKIKYMNRILITN